MANFRNVYCKFWSDSKVIDSFTPEDKLFWIYLITNERSSILGVYKLIKKIAAFEIGYSNETVDRLFERFEDYHKLIKYNNQTKEVALLNWGKYNMKKGGAPIKSCVKADIEKIEDKSLVSLVISNTENNISNDILEVLKTYNVYVEVARTTSTSTCSSEVDDFFDKVWKLYPQKKGRGSIKNKSKKNVYKLGEEFIRCIERYIKTIEIERLDFPSKNFQNGSTFFNSGYVDFLDKYYSEEEIKKKKIMYSSTTAKNLANSILDVE